MTTRKTLLISIACGAVAVILASIYLHIRERAVTGGGELRRVLVAAVDIDPHSLMEPGLVKGKNIPRLYIQPGALTDRREIMGKVNVGKIGKGEQILGTKLVVGGPKSGLSFKIPKGKRGVSIALSNSQAAGGLIQPDDRVDILVTFDYGDSESSDKYTTTLFQNASVLAVGTKVHSLRDPQGIAVVEKRSKDLFGSLPEMSGNRTRNKIITFALDPDDAQKLIFADMAGDISLLLRSPTDRIFYGDAKPVKVEDVTGRGGFIRRRYREYRGR